MFSTVNSDKYNLTGVDDMSDQKIMDEIELKAKAWDDLEALIANEKDDAVSITRHKIGEGLDFYGVQFALGKYSLGTETSKDLKEAVSNALESIKGWS
jgi:hypothetical protein